MNRESFPSNSESSIVEPTEPIVLTEPTELIEPTVPSGLLKWSDGIDWEKKAPKSFVELRDFVNLEENTLDSEKDVPEFEKLSKENQEIWLYNNAVLGELDERVLQIAELEPDELEELYRNEDTTDADKSIIACVEALRLPMDQFRKLMNDNSELYKNIKSATEYVYGFNVVVARRELEKSNARFKLLTKKEREKVASGSLEDIASAALESFVMNPEYRTKRVSKYADYLYGMMLDCTKRIVSRDGKTLEEEVDLDEFQSRVIESMSYPVLNYETLSEEYTQAEFETLSERFDKMQADYNTGHHFLTDAEKRGKVSVSGEGEPRDLWMMDGDENTYAKRVRSNNDEVFKYNKNVAKFEMKSWADKIDLEYVEKINQREDLSCEDKLGLIMAYAQETFGILNLNDDGESLPIELKWFQYAIPKTFRKKLNSLERQMELPEEGLGTMAYYNHNEKSIYYPIGMSSKERLSLEDIGTVIHEMWHAKQHDVTTVDPGELVSNDDLKVRMYEKNDAAYVEPSVVSGTAYRMQIMEQEAFALENEIHKRLIKRRIKAIGKKALEGVDE